MKTLRFILLVIALVSGGLTTSTVRSQYSFPAIPESYNSDSVRIVKATVFPLGALVTGDAPSFLDSLKSVSINTVTNFGSGGGQEDVFDTLGWVGGGAGWIPDFTDFHEQRMYFFSGNAPQNSPAGDTNKKYDYGKYNNFFHSRVVTDGQEASVSSSTGDTLGYQASGDTLTNTKYAGQYVLRAQRFMRAFTGDTNRMAHYFDFMYRFDSTDVSIYNDTDILYQIEIWIRGAKDGSIYTGETWKLYDSILYIPITKGDIAVSDSMWEHNELEHVLYQPFITGFPNTKYKRKHIVLNRDFMRRFYTDGFSSPKKLTSLYPGEDCFYDNGGCTNQPSGIFFDFRIRRVKPIKMFVKGLRMREAGAEKLLTGGYDSVLAFRLKMISTSKVLRWNNTTNINDTLNGSYYPNLLNLQTENEPYPDRYYIISYLDRYARDHNDLNGHPFKRFTAFSPWSPREIRLIWDDILWKSNLQNAAPQHMYRNIDYQSGDYIHLGLPRDIFPKSLPSRFDLYRQAIVIRTDSAVEKYQHDHDSLMNLSFRSLLAEVNQAAFGIGTQPVPYWIMGQAYTGLVYRNSDGSVNNFVLPGKFSTALSYIVDEIKSILADTSTHDCSALARVFDGTKVYDTAHIAYDRANVTSEQIRLQANMCIAYGAKGFTVSNAGINGLREYGFTGNGFDHSTDVYDTTIGLTFDPGFDLSDSIIYYQVRLKGSTGDYTFTKDGSKDTSIWEYRGSGCSSRRGQYIPYHSDPLYCLNDCSTRFGFGSWMPTFYGFKTRYEGVKLGMGDINKVADTLVKLTWDTTCNYINYPVGGLSPSKFIPIKKLASIILSKKRRSSESDHNYADSLSSGIAVKDDSTKQYVEVATFHDSTQKFARYIYVVNRRVWANKPSDDTTTDNTYLGNVAVRKIRFTVATPEFLVDSNLSSWEIADLSNGKDTIIYRDSLYDGVLLEPGEGHLLRITPARSLTLGKMDNNLFNNARHVAPIEVDNPSGHPPTIKGYIATYAGDGKIKVSYPVEDTSVYAVQKRHDAIPTDSIIDNAGNCLTPAIAYNKRDNAIGLIYTSEIDGVADSLGVIRDTNIIWYRRSLLTTPYAFSARKALDTLIIVRTTDQFLTTPAIVPANDILHDFWVSWRAGGAKGGRVGIVRQDATLTSSAYFSAGNPSDTKFISLASNSGVTGVHIAWEEYSGGFRDIWYIQASWNAGYTVSTNGIKDLTFITWWCQNHHPQIATDDQGGDHVVWEVYSAIRYTLDSGFWGGATVLRERDPMKGWGDYSIFFQISGISSQNFSYDANHIFNFFPNISSGGNDHINIEPDVFATGSNLWKDFKRISWNNVSSDHIDMVHWGFPQWLWQGAVMLEGSLEPSMAECSSWQIVPSTMLFRAPAIDMNGNNAKITRYRFPNTPVYEVSNHNLLWRKISAVVMHSCREPMHANLGGGTVTHTSTITPFEVQPRISAFDTVPPPFPNPIGWNDRSARTYSFTIHGNDTLRFSRYFELGSSMDGIDTVGLKDSLKSAYDFLVARFYLRRKIDSSVITVLDTAMITKFGFYRSGTNNDIQKVYTIPSGISTDSAFISMEMMRGDTTNSFQLCLSDIYATGHSQFDTTASFKRAAQSQNIQTYTEPVKITVIPNPFHSSARVSIDAPSDVYLNVSLFDELGKEVQKISTGSLPQTHSEFILSSQSLSTGFYYLRVESAGQIVTRKVEILK